MWVSGFVSITSTVADATIARLKVESRKGNSQDQETFHIRLPLTAEMVHVRDAGTGKFVLEDDPMSRCLLCRVRLICVPIRFKVRYP